MKERIYNMVYDVEEGHWWYRVRRLLVFDLLDKYAKNSENILDVGCGAGLLLSELKKRNKNVFGIDVSEQALQFCRQRGLENLFLAKADSLPFNKDEFDVVLLLDMLEHIKDDESALKEAFRVLKPGGVVIIFVPCFNFLWTKNDDISHHYRRYRMPELSKKVEKHFTILKKSYFNFFLFPLIFFLILIMKLLNIKLIAGKKINNKITDFIWYTIFKQELFFLKFLSFPFGVSACIVAEKN